MSQADRAPSASSAPELAALLAQARDGDVDAFEAVAASRVVGSWRLARAILGSDTDASDALTNALLAAWRELPRLEDLYRFDDWLDRILISECRMRLVHEGRSEVAGSMPPDLLDRTMDAVRASPPRPARSADAARRSRAGRGPGGWANAGVAVLAVAVVATLAILVPGWLADRGGIASVDPSASTSPPEATASTDTIVSPSPSVAPTVENAVHVGSLALVTLEGDNLRVRSAPGISDASKRLKPVLPAGTRMLVVGGPVEASGYTWWEVQTDSEVLDLFGWVAAADGDTPWIAPTAPRCFGAPDADAVISLTRIDFLACHGNTQVAIHADADALWEAREIKGDCGWVRKRDGCDVDAAWLLLASTTIRMQTGDGEHHDFVVAVPPDLAAALATLPRQQSLTLTISMDDPEARSCNVRDTESGALLIPRDRAITQCRLQFVIQEVEFRLS